LNLTSLAHLPPFFRNHKIKLIYIYNIKEIYVCLENIYLKSQHGHFNHRLSTGARGTDLRILLSVHKLHEANISYKEQKLYLHRKTIKCI
jgi:hypothetical protein